MREDEKKRKIPWEMVDPKPPVIQSGHLENRRSGQAPKNGENDVM